MEKLAREGKNVVPMPKMLKGVGGYSFSYSGLKTAVINYVHHAEQTGEEYSRSDVACSFQHAAIDILAEKALEACEQSGYRTLTVGGGVAANGYLRETLTNMCTDKSVKLVLPPKVLCTDNAAMIGAEGYLQYRRGNFSDLSLNASARVGLG